MGFRSQLLLGGVFLTGISYFLGYWTAWVGITLIFLSAVLMYLDKE